MIFVDPEKCKYSIAANLTKDTTLTEFKKPDHDSVENELNLSAIVPVPSCAELMNVS